MRDILESYTATELKKEISKYNHKVKIAGYSKLKKADLIELMLKHKETFKHMTKKEPKARAARPKPAAKPKPAKAEPAPKAKPAAKPKPAKAKPAAKPKPAPKAKPAAKSKEEQKMTFQEFIKKYKLEFDKLFKSSFLRYIDNYAMESQRTTGHFYKKFEYGETYRKYLNDFKEFKIKDFNDFVISFIKEKFNVILPFKILLENKPDIIKYVWENKLMEFKNVGDTFNDSVLIGGGKKNGKIVKFNYKVVKKPFEILKYINNKKYNKLLKQYEEKKKEIIEADIRKAKEEKIDRVIFKER